MSDPQQPLIEAALARGLLTPAQLEQARAELHALTAQGHTVDLLRLLGQRLPPAQVEGLRRLHAELTGATSFSPTAPTLHTSPLDASSAPTLHTSPLDASSAPTLHTPPPGLGSTVGGSTAPTVSPGTQRHPALPQPGDVVGGFRIEAELARGGMGVVYRARDEALDRPVALKLVLGEASAAAEQRFRVEAQASAQIAHPHVAQVHAAGRDEAGRAYLAMEFVTGESLKAKLARDGLFMPEEALRLTRALADGLRAAHTKGILHRDLKPENVLITADGQPKLTDFGLARQLDAAERLTKTGEVMGTPSYMPPEQASGEKDLVDERADVYGLGATLYHLLTSEPPFTGSSVVNILTKLMRDPPTPPRKLAPGIPAALEAVCLRCLEKHPDDRYGSMAELIEALDRVSADGGAQRTRTALIAALVCVGVAGLAFAAGRLGEASGSAPATASAGGESPDAGSAGVGTPDDAAQGAPGAGAPEAGDGSDGSNPRARVSLDPATWLTTPAVELRGASGIRRVDDGLRLIGAGRSFPHVRLPLTYAGGDFAVEVEARVHTLDAYGSHRNWFGLYLDRLVDGEAVDELRFETRSSEVRDGPALIMQGQGYVSYLVWNGSWETEAGGNVEGQADDMICRWRAGDRLVLRVRYDAAERRLSFESQLGDHPAQAFTLLAGQTPQPGDYGLRIGLNQIKRPPRTWFADVTVSSLSVEGLALAEPDALAAARLGHAGRHAVADDLQGLGVAQAELGAAAQRQPDPGWGLDDAELAGHARLLEALALARAGRDEAVEILAELARADAEIASVGIDQAGPLRGETWFSNYVALAPCALDPAELEALTRALRATWGLTPAQSLALALQRIEGGYPGREQAVSLHSREWALAVFLFRCAAAEGLTAGHEEAYGRALLRAGRFADALEQLDGHSPGRAGYAAYRLRRFEDALERWRAERDLERYFGGYYQRLSLGLQSPALRAR